MARVKFDTVEEYQTKIENGKAEYQAWKKANEKAVEELGMKQPYQMTPMELIQTTYLTDAERSMYLRILANADNENGTCFTKSETFAKQIGKDEKTVRRLLNQLKDKKMIDTTSYCDSAKRYIILKPYPVELYEAIYFDDDSNTKFKAYVMNQINRLQVKEEVEVEDVEEVEEVVNEAGDTGKAEEVELKTEKAPEPKIKPMPVRPEVEQEKVDVTKDTGEVNPFEEATPLDNDPFNFSADDYERFARELELGII